MEEPRFCRLRDFYSLCFKFRVISFTIAKAKKKSFFLFQNKTRRGNTQAPTNIFGQNVVSHYSNVQGGFSFENVSSSLPFGGHQQATTSSGFVNQPASAPDLNTKVQELEAKLSQMHGLLYNLAVNQGATNQIVQDLSSEISEGSGVELGVILIKNMRDCETEYERISKIHDGFGDLLFPDSFTGIQGFFSAFQVANPKSLSEKERIDMNRSVRRPSLRVKMQKFGKLILK